MNGILLGLYGEYGTWLLRCDPSHMIVVHNESGTAGTHSNHWNVYHQLFDIRHIQAGPLILHLAKKAFIGWAFYYVMTPGGSDENN